MAQVLFLQGSQSGYESLEGSRSATTFYLTDENNLYLGDNKLNNAEDIVEALKTIQDIIGDLEDLNTDEQSNLVVAINEVVADIKTTLNNSKVTVTDSNDDTYAKIYTLTQNGSTIGTINIPKDMVVTNGKVEKVTEENKTEKGHDIGTYIVLTIANTDQTELWIDVGTLVDIYTAKQNAEQIQIVIDPVTREISAAIVAKSVTDVELADNAVTTDKIKDGNVTKNKIDPEFLSSFKEEILEEAKDDVSGALTWGTF